MTQMDKDYPYLRAWCAMMGSRDYYTIAQLEKARKEKAPEDAIYFSYEGFGVWQRYTDITDLSTKQVIDHIMKERLHV